MSVPTDFEKRYSQLARSLAQHLISFAKDRKDEDGKMILANKSELCRVWREEQDAKRNNNRS